MPIRLKPNLIETVGTVRNARVYVQWLLRWCAPVGSVLDVGCGDGVVQAELPRETRYQGIDIGADIYRRSPDPRVAYIADYPSLKSAVAAAAPRDVTLLLDVLEHTPDGIGLLEAAAVGTQKHILVALPNELRLLNLLDVLFRDRVPGAHGFSTLPFKPGHRHQWLVNVREAVTHLPRYTEPYGFTLSKVVYVNSLPASVPKQMINRAANLVLPWRLKATSFALLFSKCAQASEAD